MRWLAEGSALGPRAYHWAYDAGLLPVRSVSAPVISVGALTVGGAGKTPFCEVVVERLRALGVHPAVVSRGYGRTSRGVVVVGRGGPPAVGVGEAGDEPWLLARRTGAVVVVGRDRRAAAEAAIAEGAGAIVLDDGFQHRRLHRDLDLVLVDAALAPRDAFVIPIGRAREPPSALARADLVVAYDGGAGRSRSAPGSDVVVTPRPEPWTDLEGRPAEPPRRAFLVSAIARPRRFRALVARLGVEVVGHWAFLDHRWLGRRDVEAAWAVARRAGADGLVTTEKDAVRWPDHRLGPVRVLPIRLEVTSGSERLDARLKEVSR